MNRGLSQVYLDSIHIAQATVKFFVQNPLEWSLGGVVKSMYRHKITESDVKASPILCLLFPAMNMVGWKGYSHWCMKGAK